jgi:glycosyltransferase involved in cell wall biosynthesis
VKLSILIPVYNDRDYIEQAVAQVKAVPYSIPYEIVAVDDYSTDGSRELLEKIPDIQVILHEKNTGKGGAIQTGLKHCTGDLIAIQDDDCEYDPSAIPALIAPILRGDSEVVYGSRFLRKNLMYPIQRLENIAITTLGNILLGQRLTDIESGHKVFSRKVAERLNLQANGFEFDMEITIQIVKLGYRIKELPTKYAARTHEEGKKITFMDGIKTIRTLLKYTLGSEARKIKLGK